MIPGPKARRHLRILALCLALGVAGAALVALLLAGATPAWAPAAPAPDASAAETFEHAVVRQLTAVRDQDPSGTAPGGPAWASMPWSVSLRDDDLRAWLSHRLEPWALNRDLLRAWPADVSRPLVVCDEGVIHVAVRLGGPDGRLAHFSCVPRIADDGSLWLSPTGAGVGRLRLPPQWVLRNDLIGRGADPQTTHLLECLRGEQPLADQAMIPLEGRRRVRILDLSPHPGRLEVRCRTELAGPGG
ncbi:MAG: hypothetical protein DYG92_02735 [Leptolyngbya sp. PLA1]|nr:hypothetical protein [Leptolyngbya sp. PLA1]